MQRCALWLGLWLGACGSSEVVLGGEASRDPGDGLIQPNVDLDSATWTPFAQPSAFIEGISAQSPWLAEWRGELLQGTVRELTVRLRYSEDARAAVGSVVFGQGPAPAAAGDPRLGYPKPLDPRHQPGLYHHDEPAEGFAYTILAGAETDGVLRFAISFNQLWSDWCLLQPDSYFHAGLGRYSCTPEGMYPCTRGGDPGAAIDCGRAELCDSLLICVCWPNHCAANLSIVEQFELALGAEGTTASGTTSVYASSVLLARQ